MKLTANNEPVILFEDSSISIERNSPLFNDETGAFSYPMAVPRRENNKALGHPGRLTRHGDIPEKSFVLEDNGVKLMTGTIDFDEVNENEAGIMLQSGMTEFYSKMNNKTLKNIDFEQSIDLTGNFLNRLAEWNAANEAVNADFVCLPFRITSTNPDAPINIVNGIKYSDGSFGFYQNAISRTVYCLQFRLSFLVQKIFESAGYIIVKNDFITSNFNKVVIWGKLMTLYHSMYDDDKYQILYAPDKIELAELMPDDENVIDFLAKFKNLFCVVIDIDERKKEVSIYFKKEIFNASNIKNEFQRRELTGWKHKEQKLSGGMKLSFSSQKDENDCEWDYKIYSHVDRMANLPAKTTEFQDKVVQIDATGRHYKLINDGSDYDPDWQWKRFGRLKPYVEGNAETEFEIKAIVPVQDSIEWQAYDGDDSVTLNYEIPTLDITVNGDELLTNIPFTISIYHGKKSVLNYNLPFTSFDKYTLNEGVELDIDLLPATIHSKVYSEWMTWKTYSARECTKYLELSLWEVVHLQWYHRYMVNGVALVLSKVNYELPYEGFVKIEAFTS